MRLGLVGLGRMGANMTRRLLERGHDVVAFDLDAARVSEAREGGARGATSLEELTGALVPPRAVWVMVPHGAPTRETVRALLGLLEPGDVLVDGGNSHWPDSVGHAELASERGVDFLDVGVSGGVWGLEEGYNMMAGGPEAGVERIRPVLDALAPENGWAHVGGPGAGHFVKMVHNAVEYGMLQALGEGFECLERSGFDLDLGQIAELWQNGAVVRSWLLELLARAFREEGGGLDRIGAWVDDSGTGRWTVDFALENEVPIPVITQALYERFDSRIDERFAHRVVAALRNQFGGHAVRPDGGDG